MAISPEDMARAAQNPMESALTHAGITPDTLAAQVKEELTAHKTQTQTVKGLVRQEQLPAGVRIIAQAVRVKRLKDSEGQIIGGDTVISWDEVDWNVRQRARSDAHKLLNHYPKPFTGLSGEIKDGKIIVTCE